MCPSQQCRLIITTPSTTLKQRIAAHELRKFHEILLNCIIFFCQLYGLILHVAIYLPRDEAPRHRSPNFETWFVMICCSNDGWNFGQTFWYLAVPGTLKLHLTGQLEVRCAEVALQTSPNARSRSPGFFNHRDDEKLCKACTSSNKKNK